MRSVVIITNFDFDDLSGAAWSRVLNYSKALSEENIETILVSSKYNYFKNFAVYRLQDNLSFVKGIRINYKNTLEDFHFRRQFRFLKSLNQYFDNRKSIVYFLYGSNFAIVLLLLIYLRIYKNKIVYIEKNELKTAIALNIEVCRNSIISIAGGSLLKIVKICVGVLTDILAAFFSGIIVISTQLEKLYIKYNKNLIRVPILIDLNETIDTSIENRDNSPNCFRIGYFGWIGEKKDNVFSLINAVNNVSMTKNVELHLFGNVPIHNQKKLDKSVDNKTIFYHGNIPLNETYRRFKDFNLLGLIRSENLQTKYGFSTKLGEYLISGVPTLITSVGDNCLYLEDGESAFIMQAKSQIIPTELERYISEICSYDEHYLYSLGQKGKEQAINAFYYRNYKEQIITFFFKS